MEDGHAAGGVARAAAIPALALIAAAAFLLAGGAATGERDAPVLGGDGVWRAGEDWSIDPAEDLAYADVAIEAAGNLTLEPGAVLLLENVTLTFVGNGSGSRLLVGLGANLLLMGSHVASSAPGFFLETRSGALLCVKSTVHLASDGGGESALRVLDGDLSATSCTFRSGGGLALLAERSTVSTLDSAFLSLDGTPAPIRLRSGGPHTLDATDFGTLLTAGSPKVTLYASVTFRLTDGAGAPVAGRVNGSTKGLSFFYNFSDAGGVVGPVRLRWMLLDPAPDMLPPQDRRSAPVRVTGLAPGVGGNTTTFVIDGAHLEVHLPLDLPFDLGLQPFTISGGEPTSSGQRAFYVGLGGNNTVSVRVRNGAGQASPAVTVRVFQYEVDPASFAVHAVSRELAPLTVRSLDAGESETLTFEHEFGPWGTLVQTEGPCYRSTRYFSLLAIQLEVGPDEDYGPWNNTVTSGAVAFEVVGDPEDDCLAGSGLGAVLVGVMAAVAVGGAVAIGYYFSGNREARRAARKARKKQDPPPPGTP